MDFWQEDAPTLANGALYLSTLKHNGKSGTDDSQKSLTLLPHPSLI
jgi:hypothetical protein